MNEEYISVGEYAKFVGLTTQQIYNQLHNGVISGFEFTRGRMKGWLVKKPVGFNTWKEQEIQKSNNN